MAANLLQEMRKHSHIDIDCNDAEVARKFQPFQDMTSNQMIVLAQVRQTSHADLIPEACLLAQKSQSQFADVSPADLAVDYVTALLGKRVADHLHPQGFVHAQTLPSAAYSSADTIKHALRLVQVYRQVGVPKDRVCIKVPCTPEGLEACEALEGLHDVRTLATTCFSVAQGLAAGRAGCRYVAPYVNPLIVHVDPSQHEKTTDPLTEMTGTQVTFAIQKAYKDRGVSTQVLAASFITAEEMFSLCGIDHVTLSAAGLALLQATPLDKRFEDIRDRSLKHLKEAAKYDPKDPFFTEDLKAALAEPRIEALLVSALTHFAAAEVALRSIAMEQLVM